LKESRKTTKLELAEQQQEIKEEMKEVKNELKDGLELSY
jgi:hypothetical protein